MNRSHSLRHLTQVLTSALVLSDTFAGANGAHELHVKFTGGTAKDLTHFGGWRFQ